MRSVFHHYIITASSAIFFQALVAAAAAAAAAEEGDNYHYHESDSSGNSLLITSLLDDFFQYLGGNRDACYRIICEALPWRNLFWWASIITVIRFTPTVLDAFLDYVAVVYYEGFKFPLASRTSRRRNPEGNFDEEKEK